MASIALIGPGRHGTAIAQLFASHGVNVVLYHHRPEKAQAAAKAVRAVAKNATVTVADTLANTIEGQEFVILTTLWNQPQKQVINELGDLLKGKVLLDISNPLDVTPAGILPAHPKEGSAGQFLATLLPPGTGHAKAFCNMGTIAINEAADKTPPAAMPFIADSAKTAEIARMYLSLTSWQPWLIGDISKSKELEIGGNFTNINGRYGRSRLDVAEMEKHAGPEAILA